MTPSDIEAEFSSLAKIISLGIDEIASLNARHAMLKAEAASLRSALKLIEADIMANTLFEGKNQQVRDAQYHLACANDSNWHQANEALTGTQIDIESCERDIELRNRSLRAKELQMAFRIEQMSFLNTPRYYREI